MMKLLKKYVWLFEWIAAALILALGIYVAVEPSVLYLVAGIAITILGLFRLVPLLKTTEDKVLKFIYLGEMIVNVVVGILLIVLFTNQNTNNGKLLGYLVGGVLYLRALIYFIATIFRKEGTDVPKFITHIVLITAGTAIIARGGFSDQQLAWLLLGIAVLTAAVMVIMGYSNYNNYRHTYRAVEKTKEMKDIEQLELPASEEKIEVPVGEPQEEQPQEKIIQ